MKPADLPPPPLALLGLDLGQARDPAALVGAELSAVHGQRYYAVRFIHRWELGTRYTEIVIDLRNWLAQPHLYEAPLVIDETGVGRPVVEMCRSALAVPIIPITITAGLTASETEQGWHVPKKDLVGTVQLLLNQRRLTFARTPLTGTLVRELDNFKVKITAAGNETFAAWREGDHDDLVLALAILCWAGEHTPYAARDVLTTQPEEERGPMAHIPKGTFLAPERKGRDWPW